MAKAQRLVKSEPITVSLDEYRLEELAEAAIDRLVGDKIDSAIESSVADAVATAVEKIGQKRIAAEIEKVLAEGWTTVNSYGESTGRHKSLKDRIGEILQHKDQFSSRGAYIDEVIKRKVDDTINKDLKADIDAAKQKFKSEVDSVLTGVIKKAVAEHFGIKQ